MLPILHYSLHRSMAEPHSLISLLRRAGLLADADIAQGVSVEDISRRNANSVVRYGDSAGFFVKESGARVYGNSSLHHEARVLALIKGDRSFQAVSPFVPALRHFDAARQVLVTDYALGFESILHSTLFRQSFSLEEARAIGACMATLHTARCDDASFPGAFRPWILSAAAPDVSVIHQSSAASLELLRTVQRSAELCNGLSALLAEWTPRCVIHADCKFANFLGDARSPPSKGSAVMLVDWEFSDWGDPHWDTGTIFGEYLSSWVRSMPAGAPEPNVAVACAHMPVETLQEVTRAFWRAYCDVACISPLEEESAITQSLRHAAARLVLASYEDLQMRHSATAEAYRQLQLAENLIARPLEAARNLLRILS